MSAKRLLGLAMVSLWLVAGCSSAKKIEVGGACVLNSDCNSQLVCTAGKCHEACRVTTDCQPGQSCVTVGGVGMCQLPAEAQCSASVPCGPLLICAPDLRCRANCTTAADCTTGQVCVQSVCADSTDLVNGQLPQKQPSGVDAGSIDAGAEVASAPDLPTCPAGEETCPCDVNDTCNTGLTCASHLCVRVSGTGGVVGTGGPAGAGGNQGTGGATAVPPDASARPEVGRNAADAYAVPSADAALELNVPDSDARDTATGDAGDLAGADGAGSSNPIPVQGLVAYYPFNGNPNDESGNGNNGINWNCSWGTDRFGQDRKALDPLPNDFTDLAQISNCPVGNSDRSISIWVKASPTDNTRISFCGYGDGSFTGGMLFIMYFKTALAGFAGSGIVVDVGNEYFSNNVQLTGEWQHLAVTYANGQLTLYSNGSIAIRQAVTLSTRMPNDSFGSHTFGFAHGYSTSDSFYGSIDDVRLYSRALSEAEVQQLYHEGGWTGQ